MVIKSARFITSRITLADCPAPAFPEYAFIGRSNVGKSSLINCLVNKKELARTSSTPGKTQSLNFFIVNENFYITDLPGYGFAQASKEARKKWEAIISEYVLERKNLVCLFVLIDSRIPPQPIDLEFLEWVGKNEVPFAIVFTKSDKMNRNGLQKHFDAFCEKFLRQWEELPPYFFTSSIKKEGREDLLSYIDSLNKAFRKK